MAKHQVDLEYRDRLIDIGLTIAALRKLKGYSQDELAVKADLSRQNLSLIESPNVVQSFSIETLLKLADALEVDPANILHTPFPATKK